MLDTQSKNLLVPRGKMFFAKYKAGTQIPGPYREFGNCPEFTLTRDSETLQHFSSQSGLKVLDDEIEISPTLTGNLTTDDFRTENLAYWFMGEVETISTTSQTALTETFQDVAAGDVFQLGRSDANPGGYRKVTITSVTDGATTSPVTFTQGDDYDVDVDLGLIWPLAGGAAVGGDMKVTYSVAASTREQVTVGESQIEGELKFISDNPVGDQGDIVVPRVRIRPNGDLAFLNDPNSVAYSTLALTLTALKKGSMALAYRDGRPAA